MKISLILFALSLLLYITSGEWYSWHNTLFLSLSAICFLLGVIGLLDACEEDRR